MHLAYPLPPEVAHDLLDRGIACGWLEHSWQVDEVRWRMAEEGHFDALLNLVFDAYCDTRRSLAEFEALLERISDDKYSLEVVLHEGTASWPDKEMALLKVVEQHPQADELLHFARLQKLVARTYDSQLGRDELDFLYSTNEPDVLRGLASNDRTPNEYLRQMIKLSDIKFADAIRSAAKENLRQRSRELFKN